jgi:hypothetical protein
MTNVESNTAPVVKRGRGRPRKPRDPNAPVKVKGPKGRPRKGGVKGDVVVVTDMNVLLNSEKLVIPKPKRSPKPVKKYNYDLRDYQKQYYAKSRCDHKCIICNRSYVTKGCFNNHLKTMKHRRSVEAYKSKKEDEVED